MITVNAVLNLISHYSEIFLSISPYIFLDSSYKLFSEQTIGIHDIRISTIHSPGIRIYTISPEWQPSLWLIIHWWGNTTHCQVNLLFLLEPERKLKKIAGSNAAVSWYPHSRTKPSPKRHCHFNVISMQTVRNIEEMHYLWQKFILQKLSNNFIMTQNDPGFWDSKRKFTAPEDMLWIKRTVSEFSTAIQRMPCLPPASCRFLVLLTNSWRWGQHIPPKCR